METPIVRYSAVSSIENSHKATITDLIWVPDHMELNRMGVPQESRSAQCVQVKIHKNLYFCITSSLTFAAWQ